MKTRTIFSRTKLRVTALLLFVSFLVHPKDAMAGWETTLASAGYCNGVAYTINQQEYKLFGISWSTRTVYRDGNNVEIADPCANGGGNQP